MKDCRIRYFIIINTLIAMLFIKVELKYCIVVTGKE